MKLDRYRNHSIELVVDRLKISSKDRERLTDTVDNALRQATRRLWLSMSTTTVWPITVSS